MDCYGHRNSPPAEIRTTKTRTLPATIMDVKDDLCLVEKTSLPFGAMFPLPCSLDQGFNQERLRDQNWGPVVVHMGWAIYRAVEK